MNRGMSSEVIGALTRWYAYKQGSVMTKRELDLLKAFQAGAIHGWTHQNTLLLKDIEARFHKWFKDQKTAPVANKKVVKKK